MADFKDQMNRSIRLEASPSRIVSLVPSQTQLLHYLGLEDEVVGITKFCVKPKEWFNSKVRVGGTKSVDIDIVLALMPDLIIGNKEENLKDDIEKLESIAPVWMSDIGTLESALEMIAQLGKIVGKDTSELINQIEWEFSRLSTYVGQLKSKQVLYFIWKEPNMVAGKGTFVDDMLERCGLINATTINRYPVVDEEIDPEVILLSSEPYPFKEDHLNIFQNRYPNAKILLADGEMFSWYGSKLKHAPEYFIKLLQQIQD